MSIDLDALEREVNEYPDDATFNGDVIELFQRLREAEKDAERYQWLREQQWDTSSLFVIAGSKSDVRLGTYCPSLDLLDNAIDGAIDLRRRIANGDDLGL